MKEDSSGWQQPSIGHRLDARRHPRLVFEVDIRVVARGGTTKGRTVDISESGLSAVMARPIPLGEVVELGFRLPFGPVTIYAAVRNRTAFRHGFQFLQSDALTDVIQLCQRVAAPQQTD
jgi:PilZ domain